MTRGEERDSMNPLLWSPALWIIIGSIWLCTVILAFGLGYLARHDDDVKPLVEIPEQHGGTD
jgi:hypothetical protein